MQHSTSDSTKRSFQLDSITSFDQMGDIPSLHPSRRTLDFIRYFARTFNAGAFV